MKAIFKRSLSALAALAMTATCMSAATLPVMFASADEATGNVAAYGTAFDCGAATYGDNTTKVNLTDGNTGTKWQLLNRTSGDYCGVEFTVPVAAETIKFLAAGINDGGDNKGAQVVRGGFTVAYNDGTDWVDVAETTEDGNYIVVTFEEVTDIYGARMTFTQFNGYAPEILEIEVNGTIASVDVARIALQKAIAVANALTSTDYTAETWADVETALATANTAVEGDDEAAITAATTDLNAAVEALEFDAIDKLNKALAAAGEVVRYRYTADSIAALDVAVATADEYADVIEVDAELAAEMMTCAEAITAAIAALEKDNLSIGATAIADSNHATYGSGIAAMNDGSFSTRWQSANEVSDTVPSYVGVQYAQATTVDTLEIYWETSRPAVSGETVQYSADGVVWNDATNVVFGGDLGTDIKDSVAASASCYYQLITFDAVKAQYVRVYMEAAYDSKNKNLSVYEFESYNAAKTELAADSAVAADFETVGAQIRTTDTSNDLRFVTNISANVVTDVENVNTDFTAIGVVMARQDQLDAAGVDAAELTVETVADGLTVKNVEATYLRNVNLDKYGMYSYTISIVNIVETETEYVCRAYYTTADGTTVYADAIARSFAQGQ